MEGNKRRLIKYLAIGLVIALIISSVVSYQLICVKVPLTVRDTTTNATISGNFVNYESTGTNVHSYNFSSLSAMQEKNGSKSTFMNSLYGGVFYDANYGQIVASLGIQIRGTLSPNLHPSGISLYLGASKVYNGNGTPDAYTMLSLNTLGQPSYWPNVSGPMESNISFNFYKGYSFVGVENTTLNIGLENFLVSSSHDMYHFLFTIEFEVDMPLVGGTSGTDQLEFVASLNGLSEPVHSTINLLIQDT